jgi:hypothetical protein
MRDSHHSYDNKRTDYYLAQEAILELLLYFFGNRHREGIESLSYKDWYALYGIYQVSPINAEHTVYPQSLSYYKSQIFICLGYYYITERGECQPINDFKSNSDMMKIIAADIPIM